MSSTIPLIDCGSDVRAHSAEIYAAIKSVGFVYLVKYGFDPSVVEQAESDYKKFWSWPLESKAEFARANDYAIGGNSGYVASSVEKLDPTNQFEIRESFNITACETNLRFPTTATERVTFSLFMYGRQLAMTILEGVMLHLAAESGHDTRAFLDAHNALMETPIGKNVSTIRMLHYPPVEQIIYDEAGASPICQRDGRAVAAGNADRLVRCGEHSDYGSLTLLWQDDVGGLEVTNNDGEFVPATPVKNAVLVNSGDLMQRYTDDQIKAVVSGTLEPVPSAAVCRTCFLAPFFNAASPRARGGQRIGVDRSLHSTALFIHTDDGVPIAPFNGSTKYAPITGDDYIVERLGRTYSYYL